MNYTGLTTIITTILTATQVMAFECNVCHSKNPKMVAMHKQLQGQNCFKCHKIGEKLMGKGEPKDLNSLLQRRSKELECIPCHKIKE